MKLKTLTKQITTLALTAAMATTMLLSPSNVSAASKKAQRKANKAYAQAIKKNKVAKFTNYALIEVTGGGTKELITLNTDRKAKGNARNLNFYTYSKGKVKKIWSTSGQAITYNKKQKTLVSLQTLMSGDGDVCEIFYIYKYNGKKIIKKATYSYNCKAHLEDNEGNHYSYAQLDSGDPESIPKVELHRVIDELTYSKKVNGKVKTISKKEYKNATNGTVEVWAHTETTRKALIKKLSK